VRIDGRFEDWKDIRVCARDPEGDAKGAFDITHIYAASQGSILYLRFDTTNLLNIQNGPEAEGTLLVIINLPNNRELVLDMRGRRAFLDDGAKERIPWDRLKYIVGPTYAHNEFEIQIDLGRFGIDRGDAVSIQFGGSDQLDVPVKFTFSQPSEAPKRRSHRRYSGTDVRIVSFNTYYEGLSDPDREEAMGRLLNSVDGDVYCFQEEWKTEGHSEILKRLMPLGSKGRWHIHKIHGNVIASKYPLKALPSRSDRYAAVCINMRENHLFIINVHLKAMGYIGSDEDRLRIRQANDIIDIVGEIQRGRYSKAEPPYTKWPDRLVDTQLGRRIRCYLARGIARLLFARQAGLCCLQHQDSHSRKWIHTRLRVIESNGTQPTGFECGRQRSKRSPGNDRRFSILRFVGRLTCRCAVLLSSNSNRMIVCERKPSV